MEELAFKMYLVGLVAILVSLPVMIFLKDRIIGWGFVVVGLNFLAQGYVIQQNMGITWTIMPNFFIFVYFLVVIKQQQK